MKALLNRSLMGLITKFSFSASLDFMKVGEPVGVFRKTDKRPLPPPLSLFHSSLVVPPGVTSSCARTTISTLNHQSASLRLSTRNAAQINPRRLETMRGVGTILRCVGERSLIYEVDD
ncbi:hypothetical protein AVEN_136631-1 [Araneus ventricosus]|uniref:Uncharacterized protein n=1 Tax=Araneus ventricosus TaxID=182803 RepID=A0A4Y2CBG8_ARAVE|nr:hypothetical protein AVEN_136631-1 [Araneus ventricosus]